MRVQRTFQAKVHNESGKWHHIDASGMVVGRLASEIAKILRGKHLPTFTPNADCGDFVVVTNCEKVRFTGVKWSDKVYYWHTNHIGGLKQRTAQEQLEKRPELLLQKAVKGMLPKSSLGRKQLKKLKIFVGEKHNHEAQSPAALNLNV